MTLAQGSFGVSKELTSCKAAATSNISGTYLNGPSNTGVGATFTTTTQTLTIDGVVLALFDRVLLADQTISSQNGIYFVSSLQPGLSNVVLQRVSDMQSREQLKSGQFFTIEQGTVSNGAFFVTSVPPAFVFGISTIAFNEVASSPGGIVPISEGGTGANLSSNSDGGILFSQGTHFNVTAAPLAAGQLLQSTATDTPDWATLVAGSGVTITNVAGTITLASTGMPTVVVTAPTQSIAVNTRYISNDGATLVTFTLPSTSAVGDTFKIIGKGSGLFTIAQGAGQQILVGTNSSTLGATGTVSSVSQYCSIDLVCITANTIWSTDGSMPSGAFTFV